MLDIEYKMTQEKLFLLARMIVELELDEFIAQADQADTLGPFLDPTLWMKAHPEVSKIIRLAESFKTLQTAILVIYPEVKTNSGIVT